MSILSDARLDEIMVPSSESPPPWLIRFHLSPLHLAMLARAIIFGTHPHQRYRPLLRTHWLVSVIPSIACLKPEYEPTRHYSQRVSLWLFVWVWALSIIRHSQSPHISGKSTPWTNLIITLIQPHEMKSLFTQGLQSTHRFLYNSFSRLQSIPYCGRLLYFASNLRNGLFGSFAYLGFLNFSVSGLSKSV